MGCSESIEEHESNSGNKGITLYWDPISQGSRAVKYTLQALKLKVNYVRKSIIKDTRTEEFKKEINPLGTVPVIEHDGVFIQESASIIKYLCNAFKSKNSLYPRKDLKARAKVDMWFDWCGNTGRPAFTPAFFEIVVVPTMLGGDPPTDEKKKELMDKYYETMEYLDSQLKSSKYLTGSTQTIADVQVFNEVFESKTILKLDLSKYSNVTKWLKRIEKDKKLTNLNEELMERLSE